MPVQQGVRIPRVYVKCLAHTSVPLVSMTPLPGVSTHRFSNCWFLHFLIQLPYSLILGPPLLHVYILSSMEPIMFK